MKELKLTKTYRLCLFFGMLLLLGVVIGSIIVLFIPVEECVKLSAPANNIQNSSYGRVFLAAVFKCLKPVVLMWGCAFLKCSFYCNMCVIAYKGSVLGFYIGIILRAYGKGQGLILALASVFPQYFVFVPVLVYTSLAAFEFSKLRLKKRKNNKKILLKLGVCLIGCFIAALTDTYLTSLFLRVWMNGE